ncbi:hypothetical protein QL285_075795 [Trifolium repens]|nr:hypothetical protein QL285_075795 [Trifolium repens]
MRFLKNKKAIEDLSPTGFRLMFHNSIPSASFLGLGQLGLRSMFLADKLSQGVLTDSNSLLAEKSGICRSVGRLAVAKVKLSYLFPDLGGWQFSSSNRGT